MASRYEPLDEDGEDADNSESLAQELARVRAELAAARTAMSEPMWGKVVNH